MSSLKKEDLRIVFMGTPEFAVTILDALVQNEFNIVGVLTAPDKQAGRGRKIHKSAVKEYAEEKGLTILQPTNLKDETFVGELEALNANLQIVVAFRMLPKVVWQMPDYGTFNLHASLLPDYRGAAPINWAIINGETETGVTTFYLDDKIDTGEMILQAKVDITNDDTAGTLHDKLMHLGAKVVLETVQGILQGSVTRTPQAFNSHLKEAPKIHKETCRIDWNGSLKQIYDFIRGLSPYPVAWTTLNNGGEESFLKIHKASMEEGVHDLEVGQVISGKAEMKVAVTGGYIYLEEIQLPGKRRMAIRDVLNGLKLMKTASMT
ncbi:methionyl-tRNA formyltransferase [Maribacter sp. ANRC-HE7]|uniref:Methionyl-tRNA formyltransferase n=2 Tax=Maribacter aquimaris TaxID=2737171 RepID=A0ABR7UVW6_9FLAO|nr:methionyl-tRNA formyltransferase [Maribacter aquimaris]